MRRIDVLGIGLGVFVAGGLAYLLLQGIGFDHLSAGIWSQVILVAGLVVWVVTYVLRVVTHKMTYNQQLQDYEEAVLQKRLDEMSPEELAQLQAEIDQERQATK
jgi:membrane protein implicated in regulation of membrane protease activity